jgi:hypothetical protein
MPHLVSTWAAFLLVSSCRPQNGFVIARVPLSEIEAVLRLYNVDDPEDREDWLYLITRLDAELVTIHQEEADKKAETEKGKAKRPPRAR